MDGLEREMLSMSNPNALKLELGRRLRTRFRGENTLSLTDLDTTEKRNYFLTFILSYFFLHRT